MSLTPDQLNVLQGLIDTAAQASAVLQVPIERVERFLSKVTEFVRANCETLDTYRYLFLLSESSSKAPLLKPRAVMENVRRGKPVLYVNEELHLIDAQVGEARITDCVAMTEKDSKLGIVVAGSYVWQVLGGKVVGECDVSRRRTGPPVVPKFYRPISQFDLILKDHMAHFVDGQQGVRYWSDRRKRILLAGPDGTEAIFHLSLFWWLRHFVADKLRVYAEPAGLGQDKIDIVVVTISGSQGIEVKWLGENEKGTTYDQSKIDEGLVQIRAYLDNDDELVCGYLVVYDGRSLDDHITRSGHDDSLRHHLCEPPKLLFLKSETPSTIARRTARAHTK